MATNTRESASKVFGQVPAANVIAECLRVQADVPPRGALARLFGRSPLSDDSRPWYLGALGEQQVAQRLSALGPEWTVLHSVPVGTRGSDIDHVVIGAGCVFTINTKLHEDAKVWVGFQRLLVNGQKTEHLRNSRFEAQRAGRRLSEASGVDAAAQAVLVVVGAKSVTVKERPSDVIVLRDTDLVRWLRKRPMVLDADAASRLAAVAQDPVTWSSTSSGDDGVGAIARLTAEMRGWATTVSAGRCSSGRSSAATADHPRNRDHSAAGDAGRRIDARCRNAAPRSAAHTLSAMRDAATAAGSDLRPSPPCSWFGSSSRSGAG